MRSIYFLCNPLAVFWALALVAAVSFYLKRKSYKVLLGSAMIWLFCFSMTPISPWLIHKLEKEFNPVNRRYTANKTRILVLGAGYTGDPRLHPAEQLSQTALARVVEGIRLYRQNEGSSLVFSGHAPGPMSQGEAMSLAAVALGVCPNDTVQLRSGRTTVEELQAYKKRFGAGESFVLVTNAFHIKRAMLVCKKLGLHAMPAPMGYYVKDSGDGSYSFGLSTSKLEMAHWAFHEYGGILQLTLLD